jgi:hypothetical protein
MVLVIAVIGAIWSTAPAIAQTATTNLVPNNSLEQVSATNPNMPASWSTGRWGDHDARFTYRTTGRTGGRSIQIDMTRYVSGDAKWYFAAQPVNPGQTYRISDYYQATVSTSVVVAVTFTDGTVKYYGLRQASPASMWTEYVTTFTMPANAQRATVFHLLKTVGQLITDDYALTPYTAAATGFSRGIISITLDDGSKGQFTNGLPLLERYGMKRRPPDGTVSTRSASWPPVAGPTCASWMIMDDCCG